MPDPKMVGLDWPKRGIVENAAYFEQPEASTTDAKNVRNFDSLERRNRGGQRTGMAKFIATQPNGTNDLQLLLTQVEAVALAEDAGFESKYANPAALPGTLGGGIAIHPDGDRVVVYDDDGSSYSLETYPFDEATGIGARIQSSGLLGGGSATTQAELQFNADGDFLLVFQHSASVGDAAQLVYPFSKTAGVGSPIAFPSSSGVVVAGESWRGAAWHPTEDILFVSYAAVTTGFTSVRAYSFNGSTFSLLHQINAADGSTDGAFRPVIAVAPNGAGVVVVGSAATNDLWSWAFDVAAGFSNLQTASGGSPKEPSFSPDSSAIVYLSGTDVIVRTISFTSGFGSAVSQASGFAALNRARFSPNGQYIAVVGNDSADSIHVSVYPWTGAWGAAVSDPGTPPTGAGNDVAWHTAGRAVIVAHNTSPFFSAYGFQNATTNPSARRQRMIAVSGGSVYRSLIDFSGWGLTNSGASAVISAGVVRGVEAFQKMFFVDSTASGYKYLDYADNTVKTWTPTDGALPVGAVDTSIGARLIALYRGRIVLSGLLEDPQNWFMSASGDPLDWDYSPTSPSPIQAVAGNNSEVGTLGEVVTCLAPFQDDVMIMGGTNSIWIMRGDPAAGGAIDNVSRQIGIVGPDAYTWDTAGNLYFFGQNGMYRMAQNSGTPELISKGRLDNTFSNIDTKNNRVWMVYDAVWQGIHIFVIPESEPTTAPTHYFWDERNDAFWFDTYPAAVGPTCVHLFQSDDPDQRGLLMGGFDGYVRQFQDDALDDDGTAIDSFVRFPPINPGMNVASARLDDLAIVLDKDSQPVTLKVFTGDSVEDAEDNADAGTARLSRTLKAGRNPFLRNRISQNAMLVQLSQNALASTWAYEKGTAKISILDRMRGRSV